MIKYVIDEYGSGLLQHDMLICLSTDIVKWIIGSEEESLEEMTLHLINKCCYASNDTIVYIICCQVYVFDTSFSISLFQKTQHSHKQKKKEKTNKNPRDGANVLSIFFYW